MLPPASRKRNGRWRIGRVSIAWPRRPDFRLVFTTARGEREQSLMTELKKLAPDAAILPPVPELPLFLAVLARAGVFISGDTGPLHFAAGLGVPTISLFGPSSPAHWAPIGERHRVLTGSSCACDGNLSVCQNASHCLAAISPEQVFACLQTVLRSKAVNSSCSRRRDERISRKTGVFPPHVGGYILNGCRLFPPSRSNSFP